MHKRQSKKAKKLRFSIFHLCLASVDGKKKFRCHGFLIAGNLEKFVSCIYFGKFENIPRSFQNIDNISYLLKFRKLRNMFSQLGRKNDVGWGILKNVDNYCHFQWMVARVRQRPGRENCGHIIDWCFSSTVCPQGFNAPQLAVGTFRQHSGWLVYLGPQVLEVIIVHSCQTLKDLFVNINQADWPSQGYWPLPISDSSATTPP